VASTRRSEPARLGVAPVVAAGFGSIRTYQQHPPPRRTVAVVRRWRPGSDVYDLGVTAAANLPGAELVDGGLSDLRAGRETEAALLVAIAAPRLRALGLDVPAIDTVLPSGDGESPEHRLYLRLAAGEGRAAHSRYNALLRRIARFAGAAERATRG
jgi:hypothetical protein